MKILRPFLLFLFFVVAATFILSLVLPVNQKIEKTITINAPVNVVYDHLSRLSGFTKWALWTQNDPTAKYTFSGNDGTAGASTHWTGDPAISGDGDMRITSLEANKRIVHQIEFIKPAKRSATSSFTLYEKGGTTTVTWNFAMKTPRPWNVFNLFYSMEKEKGAEFEKGLSALKTMIESEQGTAGKTYEVHPFNFPSTRYAIIREKLQYQQMGEFFSKHFSILADSLRNGGITTGIASGLFFVFQPDLIDVAAALPVDPETRIENSIISTYDIPASKALYVDFQGPYSAIMDAYSSLNKYISENKLRTKPPAIELYNVGPANETDSTKWRTRIIYIVE